MPARTFPATVAAILLLGLAVAVGPARASDVADAADHLSLRDYYSGNGLLNRGLYDLAAAEYRKFLDGHPGDAKAPVARYGLAVSLYRLGRLDEAARELTTLAAVPDFEFSGEVAVLLGQCRLAKGEYSATAETVARLLKSKPDHALAADATALLVEALYHDGQYAAAEEQAQRFMQLWPSNAAQERVTLLWGMSLMGRHEWAAAAERLASLARSSPASPLAEQAELLLAQCHEQRGTADEAARAYEAIVARSSGRFTPDALLALAGIALRQNRPRDAAELLDRLLREPPDDLRYCTAVVLRARAALALDRPDESIELLQAPGARCDNLADQFAYWRAKAELHKGDYSAAEKLLAEIIQQRPQSTLLAELRYAYAVALAQQDDPAAAVQATEEFLARHAKHDLEPEGMYLLATLEHRRKHYDRSGDLCSSLLERFPQHPRAAAAEFLAAENLLRDNRTAEAATAYARFLARCPNDAQAPAAAFRLGTAFYRLDRLDDAIGPLTSAAQEVAQHPQFRESLLLLGDLYLRRSEWKTAETWLAKYLDAPEVPAEDEALLKLGLARARQGQPEAALTAFDQLGEKHPQSAHGTQAGFERGQALLALGRLDAAQAEFERVLSAENGGRFKPHALLHLGAIAAQKKDFRTAAERFGAAAESASDDSTVGAALAQQGQALSAGERYAEAEAVLTRLIERYPAHEQAAESRARLAIALARQDKAAEGLRVIEQVEQAGATVDGGLRSGLAYEKAWCLRKLGRTAEALTAYRAVLAANDAGPQRAHATLELAELLAAAGQCDESVRLIESLRAAADFTALPEDAQARALYRLGTCAFEAHQYDATLTALEPLLKNAPQHVLAGSAAFYCGEACFQLRRLPQAAEYLTRVAERPQRDDVYGPSLLRLGECLAALERWARSEEVFSQYLRELPSSEPWYQAQFGVGWARENLGRHDEAIEAYRTVVERHNGPTAARAQFQIGECLFAKNKYAEAVAELLKTDILYAYPEWSAAALYEAGRCFEQLGKAVEARQQFQAVKERFGASHWAELAAQRLAVAASDTLPGRSAP